VAGSAELLAGSAPEVAPRLLGSVLRHETKEGPVGVRLSEVEAYDGANDPGSHAYRGMTRRNRVMFGPPGHVYVYFTYGMHHCMNLVCGEEGTASAVLLRAGEVVEGEQLALSRRPRSTPRDLARGPARLCTVLGIDLSQDGQELSDDGPLALTLPQQPSGAVVSGPRVGLRHGAGTPWRFWLDGDRTVSTYRPAKKLSPKPPGTRA